VEQVLPEGGGQEWGEGKIMESGRGGEFKYDISDIL
jgi:hypothetical protein